MPCFLVRHYKLRSALVFHLHAWDIEIRVDIRLRCAAGSVCVTPAAYPSLWALAPSAAPNRQTRAEPQHLPVLSWTDGRRDAKGYI